MSDDAAASVHVLASFFSFWQLRRISLKLHQISLLRPTRSPDLAQYGVDSLGVCFP